MNELSRIAPETAENCIALVMQQADLVHDATEWDQQWTAKEFGERPIDKLYWQFIKSIGSAIATASAPLAGRNRELEGALRAMVDAHPTCSMRIGSPGSAARLRQEAQEQAVGLARTCLSHLEARRAQNTRCRRCSECPDSDHHWLPNPDFRNDDEPEEIAEADFVCKHCAALGRECKTCYGSGGDEADGPCGDCDGDGVHEITS